MQEPTFLTGNHNNFVVSGDEIVLDEALPVEEGDTGMPFAWPDYAATQEAMAKFNFVQQLTAKRTMRDNTRRTQILNGNEKIRNLLNRFTV